MTVSAYGKPSGEDHRSQRLPLAVVVGAPGTRADDVQAHQVQAAEDKTTAPLIA
jgi:hypothetical protein